VLGGAAEAGGVSPLVLTDLDGVIRRFDVDAGGIERDCGLLPGSLHRAAFAPERLLPAITGQVPDEVWREQIAAALAAEQPGSDAASAVARWSGPPGVVDREVWALLRASPRLVLVTNATSRLRSDLRALGLGFDGIVNSAEHGVAKPDPRILRIALGEVAPEEALFVDDSAANVAAAEAIGIRAHRFAGVDALAAWLRSSRS
jgi:putative hydrolase of the HAD superfamily